MIREQLKIKETPSLWCHLGDIIEVIKVSRGYKVCYNSMGHCFCMKPLKADYLVIHQLLSF